jgi:hypothetical protein
MADADAARGRAGRRAALMLAGWAWFCGAGAQPAPVAPAAQPAPVAAAASSSASLTQLDPLPHELHPNDWPQPDYFTEAAKLTHFQPNARFTALKLNPGAEPDLLVLPVQMQVFGWTPAFAALVAARLDRELEERGLNANRQTELFDLDGPYARRFDDGQITAFAAAHPKARVLALYLGRDATGSDFVTLTLRSGSQTRRAHRAVPEPAEPLDALQAMAAVLPGLLAELGLPPGAAPTDPARAEPAPHCSALAWQMNDLTPASPRALRACQALVLGSLLPEFELPTRFLPRAKTPFKLAWLAQAYVESDALAPPIAKAVQTLVWSQLELTESYLTAAEQVDSDDPVIRPLARMLWAPFRGEKLPVMSRDSAVEAYAAAAAASLPPMARAALIEQANAMIEFRPVQICALEVLLPAMRLPPDCDTEEAQPAGPLRRATRAELELVQEWRLARWRKDIEIEGTQRGDAAARQAVLDRLPARIADHPFIVEERFATDHFDAVTGPYARLARLAQTETTQVTQTIADLQRWIAVTATATVGAGTWTQNGALLSEPAVRVASDDGDRLIRVLMEDGFSLRGMLQPRRQLGSGWNYLRPGPMEVVMAPPPLPPLPPKMASPPRPSPPAAAASALAAGGHPPPWLLPQEPPLFFGLPFPLSGKVEALEKQLAAEPADMDVRVALALLRMRSGDSLAQARALIDEQALDRRPSEAIAQSSVWYEPAEAFYLAGEWDEARRYFTRVKDIGSGSESDLIARVRLHLIDGDPQGALGPARDRLRRYEGDPARGELAGLALITGRPDEARSTLTPRLSVSTSLSLWRAYSAGQRMQGLSARQARDAITAGDLGHAWVDSMDMLQIQLNRYVTEDRLPSEDDLALIGELESRHPVPEFQPRPPAWAKLVQLAFTDKLDAASVNAMRARIETVRIDLRNVFAPLFAWVSWRAGVLPAQPPLPPPAVGGAQPRGQAPGFPYHPEPACGPGSAHCDFGFMRNLGLGADFDLLLTKAMLIGLNKDPANAVPYLRAARMALGDPKGRISETLRSAPYAVALTGYLLFSQTHDEAYRAEGLKLARAYERIYPYLAWPHALSALLSTDLPTRQTAACRAAYLDRHSMFLKLSGMKPVLDSDLCRKALWVSR